MKKAKIVTAKDLKRFCEKGKYARPVLRSPWSSGTSTYATDSKIIIRVPRLEGVAENINAPTPEFVFHETERDRVRAVFPITAKVVGPIYATVPCPRCQSADIVDAPQETCFVCKRTGQVKRPSTMQFGGTFFALKYIKELSRLPNCMLGVTGERRSAKITFDGGDGLLMPCREKT